MRALTDTDLQFVVTRLPKDVKNAMIDYRLFVGGGFIRETISGGDVKDIDLFGADIKSLNDAAKSILGARQGAKSFSTNNAITILSHPRLAVQLIKRWTFDSAEPLIESFDFTVCQACVWFDGTWRSLISDNFYSDLAARRLVYTFPIREEEAGGSILRVRKFLQRGYNIQAESLGGVISRLIGKAPWAPDERGRADGISKLLREVDPLVVIDGVEPIDEHEVVS